MVLVVFKNLVHLCLRSMAPPTSIAAMGLAMVVSSSACGQPVPIALSSFNPSDADDDALVDEAMAILGFEWERTTNNFGTLHLTLLDRGTAPGKEGMTVLKGPRCYRSAIAVREPKIVAHEIAHLLDLEHTCESDCSGENLMRGDGDIGDQLTDDQNDTMDKSRRRLTRCR